MNDNEKMQALRIVLEHWIWPCVQSYKELFYRKMGTILQNKFTLSQYFCYYHYGIMKSSKFHPEYTNNSSQDPWMPCNRCHCPNTMKLVEDQVLLYLMCTNCGWTRYNLYRFGE